MPRSPTFRRWLRRALLALGLALLALILAFLHVFGQVAAGYAATVAALVHFGSGQSLEQIQVERLRLPFGLERFVSLEADEASRTVESTAFGLYTRRAVWRPSFGATRSVRGEPLPWPAAPALAAPEPSLAWPRGASPELAQLQPERRAALESAIERAFGPGLNTHAALVVHQGRLVAERYAEGIRRDTPLLGWSMTKTVTAALVGRAIALGHLPAVEAPAPVPEWAEEGDARARITLEQLLRMTSGLAFFSDYSLPWSDSVQMLFVREDFAEFTARKPLVHAPGTHWSYSDGTSNLLARIVSRAAGRDFAQRLAFPRRELFEPLGMHSALLPVDPSGTFVGSSFAMASARDWARFGLFLCQDGTVDGRRLLPEGWVDFLTSRTELSPNGCFGAHLWRYDRASGRLEDGTRFPAELAGVVYAAGHGGQYLWIDRVRELVFLRLGAAPEEGVFPRDGFAAAVVGAFE